MATCAASLGVTAPTLRGHTLSLVYRRRCLLPITEHIFKNGSKAIMFLLHPFFWVIPRRLNFICRRFGTLSSIYEDVSFCYEQHVDEDQYGAMVERYWQGKSEATVSTSNLTGSNLGSNPVFPCCDMPAPNSPSYGTVFWRLRLPRIINEGSFRTAQ